ncbi:MAG: helix-turn-helix domain-containing protein [Calditrichaeota bacterium]|nr:helix-turn-helix domain-containing protein [Calditrichota bacterium]
MREQLGETQIVFAKRFGLSRDDIANYERGRCDIPTRVLAELDRLGI